MVGGAPEAVKVLTPFFEDLSRASDWAWAGDSMTGRYKTGSSTDCSRWGMRMIARAWRHYP